MEKEIVTNFENLYRSYKKVKSGKKFNSGTARFSNLSLEGIHILKEQLESQTYTINPYNKFKIHEPKERTIESCAFKDKVVQRCFSDYILTPKLEKNLINGTLLDNKEKGNTWQWTG